MRQFMSLDSIDPIPRLPRKRNPLDAWFAVVRPVLDPDADAGWLKAWAQSKVVADKPTDDQHMCRIIDASTGEPLTDWQMGTSAKTPANAVGRLVALQIKYIDSGTIITTPQAGESKSAPEPVAPSSPEGTWMDMSVEPEVEGVYEVQGKAPYQLWSRFFQGKWRSTGPNKGNAMLQTERSMAVYISKSITAWLKPSAPQSTGVDAWIAITEGSVLPDLNAQGFEFRREKGCTPVQISVSCFRICEYTHSKGWRFYRRITKQGD